MKVVNILHMQNIALKTVCETANGWEPSSDSLHVSQSSQRQTDDTATYFKYKQQSGAGTNTNTVNVSWWITTDLDVDQLRRPPAPPVRTERRDCGVGGRTNPTPNPWRMCSFFAPHSNTPINILSPTPLNEGASGRFFFNEHFRLGSVITTRGWFKCREQMFINVWLCR